MKLIAILSGGLDSTTMVYDAISNGHEIVGAVSFDYGQKHVKELDVAKITCSNLGIEHHVVDLRSITGLLDSSLTRDDKQIPEGHYEAENMKSTVVPNRNMIMTSIASGFAMSKKVDGVLLGVHAGDHEIYPDCREEFILRLDHAIQIADWHNIKLLAPFQNMNKIEIVKRGIDSNVPFENTWTCYQGKQKACGKCGSCQERLEAFEKNNSTDPLEYQ